MAIFNAVTHMSSMILRDPSADEVRSSWVIRRRIGSVFLEFMVVYQ